jgi:hypothetical protein
MIYKEKIGDLIENVPCSFLLTLKTGPNACGKYTKELDHSLTQCLDPIFMKYT